MASSTGQLPQDLYRTIADSVPILCVDAIIVRDGKYLLVKRNNKPLKGKYWLPGGRVYKGEKLTAALLRKVREETGLAVKIISLAGFYEDFYPENELNIDSVHTLSIVYVVSPTTHSISLDDQSIDFMWSNHLPEGLLLQTPFRGII